MEKQTGEIKKILLAIAVILICAPAYAERQWNLGVGIGLGFSFNMKENSFVPMSTKYFVTGLNVKFFVLDNLALEVAGSFFGDVNFISAGVCYFPLPSADYFYIMLGASQNYNNILGIHSESCAINAGAGAEMYLGRQLWGWGKPFIEGGYYGPVDNYFKGGPFINLGYGVYNHPEQ